MSSSKIGCTQSFNNCCDRNMTKFFQHKYSTLKGHFHEKVGKIRPWDGSLGPN
jgi:hypothetical protein